MDSYMVYDMFAGQFPHEVIQDIMSAFNNNTDEVIEYLLNMESDSPSTDSQTPEDEFEFSCMDLEEEPNKLPTESNLHTVKKNAKKRKEKKKSDLHKDARYRYLMNLKEASVFVRSYVSRNTKVIILLRGCPGSGKTTIANKIKGKGIILRPDADDICESKNHEDTMMAMYRSEYPIIIDSDNLKISDMLPYARLAQQFKYELEIIEPNVPWRMNSKILAQRNTRNIKKNQIDSMLHDYKNNRITGKNLLEKLKDFLALESNQELNNDDLPSSSGTQTFSQASQDLNHLKNNFSFVELEFHQNLYSECDYNLERTTNVLKDVGKSYLVLIDQFKEQEINESSKHEEIVEPEVENSDSVKIKLKQNMKTLEKKFPSLDKTILKNAFAMSGNNINVTVKAIEISQSEITNCNFNNEKSKRKFEIFLHSKMKEIKLEEKNKADSVTKLVDQMNNCKQRYMKNKKKAKGYFCEGKYFLTHIYSTKAQHLKNQLIELRKSYAEENVKNMIQSASSSGKIDLTGLEIRETLDFGSEFFSYHCNELPAISSKSHISVLLHSSGYKITEEAKERKASFKKYLTAKNYEFTETTSGILEVKLNRC